MSTLKKKIKQTGATFTPTGLAEFLAEKIALLALRNENKGSTFSVLDPSCGDGELLVAMSRELKKRKIKFSLTGFDSNAEYLETCKQRLTELEEVDFELIYGDFLDAFNRGGELFSIQKPNSHNKYDLIIANPPYVRTQILGASKAGELAKKYNLKGRVDLYYPFLVEMTNCLNKEGLIGVITSNKFLFNKSGESVRRFLSSNYEIIELIDLGDTKIFDAAVLPSIFIGKKNSKREAYAKFTKIYESNNNELDKVGEAEDIYTVLRSDAPMLVKVKDKIYNKTVGVLKVIKGEKEEWSLLNEIENDLVSKIKAGSKYCIGDLFKVRVGIKTTADKVFIGDKWDQLNGDKPEDELLRPLISQENIEAWGATLNENLKILYPHTVVNGRKAAVDLDKFPKTKEYLSFHKERLMSRKYVTDSGRKWYEIWVPHNPAAWSSPKLVFPDISPTPRFFFDDEGMLVNGNCYWIVAEKEEDINKLLFIQGIANSELMTLYHDLVFNNKLYSGRRRYITQYVEKYPLPDYESVTAKKIINVVKKLNESTDIQELNFLKADLEDLVKKAFYIN